MITNVSCNLRTLGLNLLLHVDESSNEFSIGTDSPFKKENAERFEKDRDHKRMIFDMYDEVFSRNPELFKTTALSPLGLVISELFNSLSFDEHMKAL